MDKDERLRRIATLVHELRQPLNLISLTCGNIQKQNQSMTGDALKTYIDKKVDSIYSSVAKSSDIIDRISHLTADEDLL